MTFPRQKKICYFSFDSIGSIFTPLLLDDALINVIDSDIKVDFFYCDSHLPACGINYFNSTIVCKECAVNRNMLFDKYKKVKNLSFIPISSIEAEPVIFDPNFFDFDSLQEIKSKAYKGINVGLGVVSSFVSKTRNTDPELNKSNRIVFNNLLNSACILVELVLKINSDNDYDEIRLCNGRSITERPIFETVNHLNKSLNVLELISSNKEYTFKKIYYGKYLPHDIINGTNLINKFWDINNSQIELAHKFYNNKRYGVYASDKVFTADQKLGLLPESWDNRKRNFIIFNSSEDEIFSLGGLWDSGKLFQNQYEGIKYILKFLSPNDDIKIYLRVHPNLNNIKYKYVTLLFSLPLEFKNFEIIAASSNVSTYTLIDNAEKCIVFGSTVGVEASFWNKPVISMAPSSYQKLNVSYCPNSISELNILLLEKLKPLPQLGSLKYGLFYFANNGIDYKFIDFNYNYFKIFNRTILLNRYLTFKMLTAKIVMKILRNILTFHLLIRVKKLYIEK